MFAYAETEGVTLRLDGTEVPVRHPKWHRPGSTAYVSAMEKQNTETYDSTRRRSQRRIMGTRHPRAETAAVAADWIGRRETLPEVVGARGDLVSDRVARHVTLRSPSTALVLPGPAAC
ncbi:hypothetical protein HEP84_57790 [Streptomyces sp. RLB1-33]